MTFNTHIRSIREFIFSLNHKANLNRKFVNLFRPWMDEQNLLVCAAHWWQKYDPVEEILNGRHYSSLVHTHPHTSSFLFLFINAHMCVLLELPSNDMTGDHEPHVNYLAIDYVKLWRTCCLSVRVHMSTHRVSPVVPTLSGWYKRQINTHSNPKMPREKFSNTGCNK